MSLFRLQSFVLVIWFAVMLLVVSASIAAGVAVTAVGLVGWFVVGCIPPFIMLKVFRGSGPSTMSQVLADASPTVDSQTTSSRHDVVER